MIIDAQVLLSESVSEVLDKMDKAGVKKALLSGAPDEAILCHSGLTPGNNRDVLAAVRSCPERFAGCAYVNPLLPGAVEQVNDWADQGFRAIKFFPADGYFADDKLLWPVLEIMEQRHLTAVFHMGLADYTYTLDPDKRRAPNSAFAYPMRLDPTCRLFPEVNFLILNMGYPLMIEAWSLHHNNGNIYLHIGGDCVQFTALVSAYCGLGGAGFIPLDFSRIVFGSVDAADILRAINLAEDSITRMGCTHCRHGAVFNTNAEALFHL